MPARKLAEAAINNKLVTIRANDGTIPQGAKPLQIWQQITTPGHLYMTSQGGKLIWTEAVKCCTEDRFLKALRETYLHLGKHPEDESKELDLYEKALRRQAVSREEMPSAHIKQERIDDVEGPIDLEDIPLIQLE